jgi:hypothetical protein
MNLVNAGSTPQPPLRSGSPQHGVTPYHAKYFAYDLTRRAATGIDRLSISLFDAAVDLNPHQIPSSAPLNPCFESSTTT